MSILVAVNNVKNELLDIQQANDIKLALLQLVATTNQQFADAISAVNQATDEVIEIGNETAQYRTFLDELGAYANEAGLEWINTGGFGASYASTDGSSTWDTNARTLTIPATKTGASAAYTIAFSLAGNASLKEGDTLKLRFILTQSATGVIPMVDFSLTANGAPVNISGGTSQPLDPDNKIFEFVFPYTITSLTANMVARIAIKTTATAQPATVTLRWDSLSYYPDKEMFISGLRYIKQQAINFATLFPVLEVPYILVSMNGGGVSDVSTEMAAYIALSYSKKKRLEFQRDAIYRIDTPQNLTAGIEMVGNGCVFLAGTAEVFSVKTNARIFLRGMRFRARTLTGTSFKFYSGFTNEGSELMNMVFETIKDALFIDNVHNLKITNPRFNAGERGIIIGSTTTASVSANVNGLTIEKPIFDTCSIFMVDYQGGSNIIFDSPRLGRYSGGGVQPSVGMQFAPAYGGHSNITIINPVIEAFGSSGLRIGVGGSLAGSTALLENVKVIGGQIKGIVGADNALPIYINTSPSATLLDLSISGTQVATKNARAVVIDKVQVVNLIGMTIRKQAGSYPAAQGFQITGCSLMRSGCAVVDCPVADVIPTTGTGANTILTEH